MNDTPAPVPEPAGRFVLLAAGVVIIVAGLRAAAPLFAPFALAAFIAVVSLPVLQFLRRFRLPTGLAILGIGLITAGVLAFFSWIVLQTAVEVRAELPGYVTRVQEVEQSLRARLLVWGVDLGSRDYTNLLQPDRMLDVVTSAARGVTSTAALLFLILLYLVFILAESVAIPAKLRETFGTSGGGLAAGASVLAQVQRYLVLKTLISLVTGVTIGAGAAALGVDFALFWGLLAFALNYVPNIGSAIAAIPAVAVALLQLGLGPAIGLATIYLVVNVVVGNFIDPIVIGRQLRLSPLIVLMSLVFWGWVWGLVGMFLAVPLTIVVRIVLEQSDDFQHLATLLGPVEQVRPGPS